MNKFLVSISFLALAGCSQSTLINRDNGKNTYLVECGAASSWSVCYNEASNVCPSGYSDIEHSSGFNRKEMKVRCN